MKTRKSILAFLLLLIFVLTGCDLADTPSASNLDESSALISAEEKSDASEESSVAIEEDTSEDASAEVGEIAVHFLDVGQADAALVICDGKAMLIDGGNRADSSLLYTYLKKQGVSHLDYLVATHAHEDHIGGLSGALNYATVDTVYCPVTEYDSDTFESFVKYVEKAGSSITVPKAGDSFRLGSATVDILACNAGSDTNNTSIVLKINHGETSFLFTGDAEREAEQAILNAGYDLSSTLLKVGHHGSETSTSYQFLREIMPTYAVISVGEDNSYGHPDDAVLSRLRDADVSVYRTDLVGTVVCKGNGKELSFSFPDKNGGNTSVPVPTPDDSSIVDDSSSVEVAFTYVLNNNTKKFHYSSCYSANKIEEKNRGTYTGSREELLAKGYSPCGNCDP